MPPQSLPISEVTRAFAIHTEKRLANAEGSRLEEAMVDETKWHQQRKDSFAQYLDETWSEEVAELQSHRQQLDALVRKFQSYLPEDLKDKATNPKSFRAVHKVVEKVGSRWKQKTEVDKFVKARQLLRKVGSTIDSHSNVLKVLPSGNDYAAPFLGAITVFIKASSNYEVISESFAQAMTEINDSVTTVYEEVLAYKDEIQIQHLVIRLYCQIFTFLIKAMEWYTDKWYKRAQRSLNENLYSQYQTILQEIRRLAEMIHKRTVNRKLADLAAAEVTTQEELKFLISLQQHDRNNNMMRQEGYFERLSVAIRNEFKDLIQEKRDVVQENIMHGLELKSKTAMYIAGATITKHLENGVTAWSSLPTSPIPICDEPTDFNDNEALKNSPHLAYTKQEVMLHAASLADYFDDTKVSPFFPSDEAPAFLADPNIVYRLRSHTVSSTSVILHICGVPELAEETQSARIASRYATATRKVGIAVVSYFCTLSRDEVPTGRTAETIELVSLMYALIRQLVELLPEKEAGERRFGDGFGVERFARLDGTLLTWNDALQLLEDLLEVNDEPLLYFVISDLNVLDDVSRHSTTNALRDLILLLQKQAQMERMDRRTIKLLFMTAGESAALNEVFDSADAIRTASSGLAKSLLL
ncbi:uncharacterized protein K452DRAFT_362533 [Aplosporella prunicola CBS 121167]|uniref:DUF7708 domain-containing protein n=1 Tax=Aplosporella prunicola CBS 121167 TaxID=1176127 RepID=A0A6A6AXU3_9PEZI|nr:uncharacterized protein K452DRAFT_362533 [Aplosporella prunicola CBS 121167]KAF2136426.1 hypothetical protein K452DRAFT_362533 [Aplosporella prunicola CBS 121167]